MIESTIDMWLRQKKPTNIVVNDPKGELLIEFYVPATKRGYDVMQLNLINPMKTNIANPLWMAASSAREGNFTDCATYVENIATVFFPVDGSEEPLWPNAANNAFKRIVYGMIDIYLEKENAYRELCNQRMLNGEYVDPQEIENYVDELWGHVTLYNCYQMFVQLAAKKRENPLSVLTKRKKEGYFEREGAMRGMDEDEIAEWIEEESEKAMKESALWNGAKEIDCLTLYFAAMKELPRNGIRNLACNADDSLKSMGGAEKMISSCDLLRREKRRRHLAELYVRSTERRGNARKRAA